MWRDTQNLSLTLKKSTEIMLLNSECRYGGWGVGGGGGGERNQTLVTDSGMLYHDAFEFP